MIKDLEAFNKRALADPGVAEELELDLVDGHHGGDQLLDIFLRTTFEKIFNPPSLLSDKYLFLRFLVLTFSPQSVE